MNKTDMIERMAASAGITKTQAAKAVEAMISGMTAALKKGGHVTVVGFGSFRTVQRAARTGRNPKSGKAIQIPARRATKFTPGLELKQAVNRSSRG